MKYHTHLTMDKWIGLSLAEQMGNIGAEVGRAINWKRKGNQEYADLAFFRSLELLDATKVATVGLPGLKEICRVREMWSAYFTGGENYGCDAAFFNAYFLQFGILSRQRK